MISRDKMKDLISIDEIDKEITGRQSLLNSMSTTLFPQIISEEIVQLRVRRAEVENDLSNQLAKATGCERMQCHIALIQSDWQMDKANELLKKCSSDQSSSESIQRIVDSQQPG